jgi:hypothetical protein
VKSMKKSVDADSLRLDDEYRNAVRELGFQYLLTRFDVPPRLRNCVLRGLKEGTFPYQTIGEYIDAGANASCEITRLPNIGKKTAFELGKLVEAALATNIFGLNADSCGSNPTCGMILRLAGQGSPRFFPSQ